MNFNKIDRLYWFLIGLLAFLTVLLSLIGWYRDSSTIIPTEFWSQVSLLLTYIDRSLLLFIGESRTHPRDIDNFWILIAQILSVVVVFGTILKLGIQIVFKRWQAFKTSRLKDHVIICGFGEGGHAFANNYASEQKVLIIDPNLTQADEFTCEENGWHYVKADAREAKALLKSGLRKAQGMIICCQDDTVNLEILELSQDLFAEVNHSDSFTFLLELNSVQLSESISDQFLSNNLHENIQLFTFSRPKLTARHFVWHEQLSEYARFRNQTNIELIFIGYDSYAQAMIDKLVSATITRGLSAMKITLFVTASNEIIDRQIAKYKYASDYITIDVIAKEQFWADAHNRNYEAVTALFVFAEDDKTCVTRAIQVRDFLIQNEYDSSPIFMRLDRDFALKDLLVGIKQTYRMGEVLQAFGMNDIICNPALITGELEDMAMQLHEQYLEYSIMTLSKEQQLERKASHVTWRQLAETLKNSNRRALDNIPAKLTTLGIHHKPGFGLNFPQSMPLFSDDESLLDMVAENEQRSWQAGLYSEGWIPGQRNKRRKRNPLLKFRYSELSEDDKGYDKKQIKAIDHLIFKRQKLNNNNYANLPEQIILINADAQLTKDQLNAVCNYVKNQLIKELFTSRSDYYYTIISDLKPDSSFFMLEILVQWLKQEKIDFRSIIRSHLQQEELFDQFSNLDDEEDSSDSLFVKLSKNKPSHSLNNLLDIANVEWIIQDKTLSDSVLDSETMAINIPAERNIIIQIAIDETLDESADNVSVVSQHQTNEKNRHYLLTIQQN